jgi:hypothetical protein
MDQAGKFVADAVLGIDTLWGGDVLCPSGTGRFIADSWFSDEPLPAAYTHPAAARLRKSGGVSGKTVDFQKPSPDSVKKPPSSVGSASPIWLVWRTRLRPCGI